jgi:hypothetical protein
MKVSVTWLGIILIGILLIGILWQGKGVYEAFTSEETKEEKEGFIGSLDDLQVSSCPANSKQFIDSDGIVLCCDGTISDGQCQGKPICSLSEGSARIPTCSTWFAAYLNEKGQNRCPASMPNYYETRDGTVKGCTAGRRNKDGSGPLTQNTKFCKLYKDQKTEEREPDSCTNQKLLEQAKCFSRNLPNVSKTLLKPEWEPTAPSFVLCTYNEPGTLNTTQCITDGTYNRFIDRLIDMGSLSRNWRSNEINDWNKMWYCSIAEKVRIDKTLDFSNVKKTPAPTTSI